MNAGGRNRMLLERADFVLALMRQRLLASLESLPLETKSPVFGSTGSFEAPTEGGPGPPVARARRVALPWR